MACPENAIEWKINAIARRKDNTQYTSIFAEAISSPFAVPLNLSFLLKNQTE